MQKDDEKVCFELIDLGENALVHINGNGGQIIDLLLSALKKSKDARVLILAAVSKFLSCSEISETLKLPASIGKAEKKDVN